jgi:nicotinamide-nucleotide amidase
MTFAPSILDAAEKVLANARERSLLIVTAESCTGGLIAGALTEIPGSSSVFERGFVTYSNAAKVAELGVSETVLARHGAVSAETARAMAEGALAHSLADVSIAVTGIAGPDGGSPGKPVGLVHVAAARRGGAVRHEELRLGAIGRAAVREETVKRALALLAAAVGQG